MGHCVKCGDSGRNLDGSLCDCAAAPSQIILNASSTVHASFIPKDYISKTFYPEFVNSSIPGYAEFMSKLHDQICSCCDLDRTMFISSPPRYAKQVFVYSVLQYLISRQLEVFPYIDVGEVGRYIRDIDYGRTPKYLKQIGIDPESMYSAPVLFIKGTVNPSKDTLGYLATFLDRRHRQGHHTIIFSYQRWSTFTQYDFNRYVKLMVGDGQINTIKIHDWGDVDAK